MEEEHKLRQGADDGLINMKEFYEAQMKEVESQSRVRIEELQHRMQGSEILIERESHQMEMHSGWKEELDQLHQLAADQEVEINNQYQRAEQFQRMSERLTTQVKHSNRATQATQAQQFRRMCERSMTTQPKPANMADQALEQAEQVEQQYLEDAQSQVEQAKMTDRDLEQAGQAGQQRLKNVKSQSTESRRQRRKKQTPGSVQPRDPRAM